MKNKKTISLIVLNFNGQTHLKKYFTSVYKQTLKPDEVVMLDNASTDDSVAYVQKNFSKVKIIKNLTNAGTALGSNIGFKHTKGKLVIFQSNDMILDKSCIENLVKTINQDSQIGIVTSVLLKNQIYQAQKKQVIDNAGGVMDVYGLGMQKYPNVLLNDIPDQEEVFFSYGGSFIIKRKIFEKVGGYDERFFTLNDDIDLSWRVRLLGFKILYTKNSIIYHKVSATLGTLFDRSTKRYWSERNALRTLLKNHTLINLLIYLPIYMILQMAEIIFFLWKRRIDLVWSDIKAILWNIWYLPETLSLRLGIQRSKVNNHLTNIQSKRSFKVMLFNSLKDSI